MNVFEIEKLKAGARLDTLVFDALDDLSMNLSMTTYSTSTEDAMRIVDKTKGTAAGWSAYEGLEWKLWWWPDRECWIVDATEYGEWGCRASAKTLPLAICRAFLMVQAK